MAKRSTNRQARRKLSKGRFDSAVKLYCERRKDKSHHSLVDNNSIYEEKDDGIEPPSFFVARKEAMLVNDIAHQRMVQEAVTKHMKMKNPR